MDYGFIEQCRKIQQDGLHREEQLAQESIIDILFRLNMKGPEKARQIDEYDGESSFNGSVMLPGQIYAFLYQASEPTVYKNGQYQLTFYDSLPILLVTGRKGKNVSGINLNLCNKAVRAFAINALHNLDIKFYGRQHLDMATEGNAPYSQNVGQTFMDPQKEAAFIKFIAHECKLQNPDILYRNYNIDRIQKVRMLEVWQHIHIPFLSYHGEIKSEVLHAIYKLTGQENFSQI